MKVQHQRFSIVHPLRYTVVMGFWLGIIFSLTIHFHSIVSVPLSQPWYLVQSFFLLAGMLIFTLIIRHRSSKVRWKYKTYFVYSLILGIMVSAIYFVYMYYYAAYWDREMSFRCSETLLAKGGFENRTLAELQAAVQPRIIALSGGLAALLWTVPCSALNALFMLYIRRR